MAAAEIGLLGAAPRGRSPMSTAPVKLSIVVPTRERCDTLQHALRTCTAQDYDSLEIVVSDNASTDATREMVLACDDPRVRYVNTGRRLSMSRNWEFALQHVQGEFVTFIGDDDGLLPGAAAAVADLLAQSGLPAVSWLKGEYLWPNHSKPERRNLMVLPLTNVLLEYDSASVVRDACALWVPYFRLPAVYNSFVSTAAMRECAGGGDFFRSVTPDVYSGAALASTIPRYLYSLRPFSLNGASAHSNGGSASALVRDGAGETARFHRENDIPLHPRLPMPFVGSGVAVIVEAFLQANDHCFGGSLRIDLKRAVKRIMREVAGADPRMYAAVLDKLLEVTAGTDLHAAVQRGAAVWPNRPEPAAAPPAGLQADGMLYFDAARFGVTEIAGACELAGNLLGAYAPPSVSGRYSRGGKIRSRLLRRALTHVPDPTI
jgi:glycosyltransferase involved in cell wall biosynthesis